MPVKTMIEFENLAKRFGPFSVVDLMPFLLGKKSGTAHDRRFWRAGQQKVARVGVGNSWPPLTDVPKDAGKVAVSLTPSERVQPKQIVVRLGHLEEGRHAACPGEWPSASGIRRASANHHPQAGGQAQDDLPSNGVRELKAT